MTVYWKDMRRGQNLILNDQDDHEEVIGGFRETKRGIDAYAQTFGYEPGRSQKGFATVDEAKDFVESFRPWEQHGVQGITVDREARPDADTSSDPEPTTPDAPAESPVQEGQKGGRWWDFRNRG